MEIFVTSDPHFFHDNIIKYCHRPCTVEEHDQWILNIYNTKVGPNDIVYCLGDLVGNRRGYKFDHLQKVIQQLNGTWNFLKGNHDNENQLKAILKGTRHNYIGEYHEVKLLEKHFVMFHFPIESWHKKHYGSIHLHGHLHNTSSDNIENRYNVCLDKEHKIYNIKELIL